MDSGTSSFSPPQRHHKALSGTSPWKPEVWPILGRFARLWKAIHEQSRQKVSPWTFVKAHTISQSINQKMNMNIKMKMNIIQMFTYYFVFRALVNAIKSHSHLMEVDALLVRSCLYLMPLDELMECVTNINIELLDMLHVFTNKVPQDVSYSNFQVSCKQNWSGTCWGYGKFDYWMFLDFCLQAVSDLLTHIQGNLVEEKYRWFAFLNVADFKLNFRRHDVTCHICQAALLRAPPEWQSSSPYL